MTKFKDLEELMSPLYNYKTYKAKFASQECPKMPYFGWWNTLPLSLSSVSDNIVFFFFFTALFLRDFTFINEGNQLYTREGLINFDLIKMLSQRTKDFSSCQVSNPKLCIIEVVE